MSESRLFRRPSLRRVGALALGVVAVLACVASPPARADEDPECSRRYEEAIRFIQDAEKTGNPASAQRAWESLAVAERRCPYNVLYPYYSCLAHVFGHDPDGAMAALGRLVALLVERQRQLNRPEKDAQSEPMVLFLRAAIDLYLGDQPARAIERLTQARARNKNFNPDEVRTLFFRAYVAQSNVLARREDYEKAIAYALLALDEVRADVSDKRRIEGTRNLGQLYRLAHRWEESQATWEGLVTRSPSDPVYHYGLASVLADQFRFDAALPQWVETIRLLDSATADPADLATLADAHLRYGVCLLHANHLDEGRRELEAFAAKNPADSRPHLQLAKHYLEQMDDPVKALSEAEKARAIDPWCESTLRLLLQIYTVAKPDAEKEKAIRAVLEDDAETKARKDEMDRRRRSRRDQTNGCD